MRYLLSHPSESRPSLVVDTCEQIEAADIDRLRRELFGLGCPNGILFDPQRCVILRDTFASMSEESIQVEHADLSTDVVLAPLGAGNVGSLDARVGRWLELLSAQWDSALPDEPTVAAPFIADIVPAASGSIVRALGTGTAA